MKLIYVLLSFILVACGGGGGTTQIQQPIQPIKVAFIGDSSVAGYQAIPNPTSDQIKTGNTFILVPDKSYPSMIQAQSNGKIVSYNFGVGGSTTVDVYQNQYQQALAVSPKYVVICTGVNDVIKGVTLQQYEELYTTMITDLLSKNIKPIVVTSVHWFPQYEAEVDIYTAMQKSVAMKYNVPIVDARSAETKNWTCSIYDLHPCDYSWYVTPILQLIQ